MTLPLPCGSGGLPTAMQDRRQLLQPVGWSSCSCRCRGIRHISNNQEQWLGLLWHTAPLGQAAEELLESLTWQGSRCCTQQGQPCFPHLPACSSLDLLTCTSPKVTSWATSTKSRRAGDTTQGGSARNSWLCLQTILPSSEDCPGDSSAAGHCTSLTHLHRSSTALQAAQKYFLGPQVQVSLPAESSWPPPEQNGRVCSHVT